MKVAPGHPGSDPLPERILPPPVVDVDWTLDRVRAVLAELGDPHLRYATLHVAGTNGKGSVAALWASVLEAGGSRTGLYTSPHLCAFRERFRVWGAPIGRAALEAAAEAAYPAIERGGLTFFEAATVLAFVAFAREGVVVGVVETGLGGRLDATTVVEPVVTAITNVGLDHGEFLGDTVPEVAREKAGIVKPGVPLVTGPTDPAALDVIRARAAELGAPWTGLNAGELLDWTPVPGGSSFVLDTAPWGWVELEVPLAGRHQAENAALAVRSLAQLPSHLRPAREAVVRGVAGVRWPGRLQVEVRHGRHWVFDVAHNPDGARALVRALADLEPPGPRVAVVGVLADKDWGAMLDALAAAVDTLVLTSPASAPRARRWDPARAAREVEAGGGAGARVELEPELPRALNRAAELAPGGTVVVTGSHHTVGDALLHLGLAPCEPG